MKTEKGRFKLHIYLVFSNNKTTVWSWYSLLSVLLGTKKSIFKFSKPEKKVVKCFETPCAMKLE